MWGPGAVMSGWVTHRLALVTAQLVEIGRQGVLEDVRVALLAAHCLPRVRGERASP